MKKYILLFLLAFQMLFSQVILVKGKAFNSGKFNERIVDIVKNDKLITRTDSIGNFEIYAKLSDSLFFQSLYHTTKKFLVADLVKKKKINIKLKSEPCEVWPSHPEKPTKLYVFVGKKIKTWGSPSGYCNGSFNDRTLAKYEVVKNVYGNFKKKTIQFTSYTHEVMLVNFDDFEYCLFYILEYKGELIQIKYLFDGVFMTKEGRWATPVMKRFSSLNSLDPNEFKPTKIDFLAPFELENNKAFKNIIANYFYKNYSIKTNNTVEVTHGYYVEDLFEIRKKGEMLKEYKYLLNE